MKLPRDLSDKKPAKEAAVTYTATPGLIVSQPVILERGGKPVLVLLPYEEYQRLQCQDKYVQAREKTMLPRLRPQRNTLGRALGLLATDRPAPSDAEVKQWLDEHRRERYA